MKNENTPVLPPNHPFSTIKQSLQYYPSIFPNVYRVLEHIFLTNGNGYEVDGSGNMVCSPGQKEEPCITESGISWLAYDLMKCDCYTVYPINSYEYEKKNGLGGNRFYTDFYAYPAMNADWQAAARWFLYQLISRNANWWRRHYKALDANPAIDQYGKKDYHFQQYYSRMMDARKHLSAFAEQMKIEIEGGGEWRWESDLLLYLKGNRD